MQHTLLMAMAQRIEQLHGDALQLPPRQAGGALQQQPVQSHALEQFHGEESDLAGSVHFKRKYTHHLLMPKAARQGKLAVEQHVGVRRFANSFTQYLDRHTGTRLTKLFVQQVPCAIDHAHAASTQHAFDKVSPSQQCRCPVALRVFLPPGKGKVGQRATGRRRRIDIRPIAHDCTTTAVRLSLAAPRNTPANSWSRTRSGVPRLNAWPNSQWLSAWYRPSLHNRKTSPAKVLSSNTCGFNGSREPIARVKARASGCA